MQPGSRVTITVGRFEVQPRRRRPPRPSREGRGAARRALVRARGLARVGRGGVRRRRGGRARGRAGAAGARRVAGTGRTASGSRWTRAAGCSAPTPCSPSCTGRSARTARSRGCSSCSTCPTWAPACSRRRCAWTRSCSRTCSPPRARRRSRYMAVREADWRAGADVVRATLAPLGLPLFVKPARLGSSVGIAKVAAADRARRRARRRLRPRRARDRRGVQRRDRGRVRGDGLPRAGGVRARRGRAAQGGADWYDYEAKYGEGGVELRVPAGIPEAAAAEVRRLAVDTFLRVGCAGLARVDFFVEDGGRVLVNELNTLPGMTPTSAFPKLWAAAGRAVAGGVRPPAGLRARAPPRRARRPRLLEGEAGLDRTEAKPVMRPPAEAERPASPSDRGPDDPRSTSISARTA